MATTAKDIAALRRQMRETNNNVLKTALKKKISRLEEDMKSQKMTAKQLATSLFKARTEIDGMNKSEFSSLIKRLSAKPEYSFLKGMTKGQVKDDLERPAKPVGWRFKGNLTRKPTAAEVKAGKRNGTVYYENRRRHSDVVRSVQLATGGGVGDSSLYLELSNIDHTRVIKWMNIQFDNESISIKKSGSGYIIDTSKLSKTEVEDLMYYLKHQDYISKYATGGGVDNIPNNYEGKSSKKVWESWTATQKAHFLRDHFYTTGKKLPKGNPYAMKWDELPMYMKDEISNHVYAGQYAKGGGVEKGEMTTGKMLSENKFLNELDWISTEAVEEIQKIDTSENSEDDILSQYQNILSKYKIQYTITKIKLSEYGDVKISLKHKFVDGRKMAKGGGVGDVNEENRDMVMNNNNQIMHHANELKEAVKKAKHIPAWVVAKVFEASSALSNVTHYLDGTTKMATGGGVSGLFKDFKYKDGSQVKQGDFIELPYSKYGFAPNQESIIEKYKVIDVDDTYRTPRLILTQNGDKKDLTANQVSQYMPYNQMATGGSLKGNQNKLDMNKNGRLDAEDFKILRGKK